MRSFYFETREEARQWGAAHANGFTLRRVNLEDVFLALTGKKIK
jgi:ABC-2 type transport system ATP-binding protein